MIYITKYALKDGITSHDINDIRICGDGNMIHIAKIHSQAYFHGNGKEWHETKESAITKAESMRVKKIANLKKQIAKLEALKFEL